MGNLTPPFFQSASTNVNLKSANPISMYYHTVVLHLFRPFLKVDPADPLIAAQEICMECADKATGLLATYRQVYGLRRIPTVAVHIALTSSIIHLLHLPSASAAHHLAQNITSLREMALNHAFSTPSLRNIMALAEQWGIELPPMVQAAIADDSAEGPVLPQAERLPFSLSVCDTSRNIVHVDGSGVSGDDYMCAFSTPISYPPFENVYWSPFAKGSVPLQKDSPVVPVGLMDVPAVLHPPEARCQQLNPDRFQPVAPNESFQSAMVESNGHWPQ